jgi:hypothetical protein
MKFITKRSQIKHTGLTNDKQSVVVDKENQVQTMHWRSAMLSTQFWAQSLQHVMDGSHAHVAPTVDYVV